MHYALRLKIIIHERNQNRLESYDRIHHLFFNFLSLPEWLIEQKAIIKRPVHSLEKTNKMLVFARIHSTMARIIVFCVFGNANIRNE